MLMRKCHKPNEFATKFLNEFASQIFISLPKNYAVCIKISVVKSVPERKKFQWRKSEISKKSMAIEGKSFVKRCQHCALCDCVRILPAPRNLIRMCWAELLRWCERRREKWENMETDCFLEFVISFYSAIRKRGSIFSSFKLFFFSFQLIIIAFQ